MRIKQLEIIGLKSFAQRTTFDFPPGITAIVGPNGCGKSNVVDAIRWVLGEQSPRHLRGESMEDVIFKGSDRLAPAGMAQVSLTFENFPPAAISQAGEIDVSNLPAHFRNLSEITITRRYFRSGESEYFINRVPCRLKDITELFLGTGVGSKAYAIIEQGRVEQLIHAKPEDRRLLIEEAGGTTLFRSRRFAAERKIERTRENLLRVSDVLRELERQVQYLHRLAKKAEHYRELQNEIRNIDLRLGRLQWRRLDAEASSLEAEIGSLAHQQMQIEVEVGEIERLRAEKEGARDSAEAEVARHRQTLAVLQSECRNTAQTIELLREEIDKRFRRLSRLQAEASALGEQLECLDEAIHGDRDLRQQCEEALRDIHERLTACERDLAETRQAASDTAQRVETIKGALLALAAEAAEAHNAQLAAERQREQANRRWQHLRAEVTALEERMAAADHGAAALTGHIDGLREALRSVLGEKASRTERVRALASQRRSCERRLTQLEQHLVQMRSRLDSLRELQRSYEGYQRGVRSILLEEQRAEGVLGVVADVLSVPAEHERALAAALGERLQYVIVRGELDAADAVRRLRTSQAGRGSFIPLTPRQIPVNGCGAASLNGDTRRLLDIVRVEEPFRQIAETLLGEVVLVPNLREGLALWQRNGVHVTLVTPEGDVIDANGVITGGSERPVEEEIVSRQRLIAELVSGVAIAEAELEGVTEEAGKLAADLEVENSSLARADEVAHRLTLQVVAAEKDLERLREEMPLRSARLEAVRIEMQMAADERGQATAELMGVEKRMSGLTVRRKETEMALAEAGEAASAAAARVDALTTERTALRIDQAERRQRLEAIETAARRLEAQRQELTVRISTLESEEAQTKSEHGELCRKLEQASEKLSDLETRRQTVEQALPVAERHWAEASESLQYYDQHCRRLRSALDELRGKVSQAQLAFAEKRMRKEHLEQSVREKYDATLSAGPDTKDEEIDEAELATRAEELRGRLTRMGEVSVGAIEELRELEERLHFLRTQKADLEASIADLERTIQKLNRASKTRFAETFERVNQKFKEIFPRLFRGGEARLVLTDENNLLDTGVEIVVRPPGKRLDSVTLLSGGEKALVAVSLLFALFLINPTPFCFLDEVDAPLDDANIERFTQLLREMSQHSQFIVITHNKRTMEAADRLYGVTMQEPGISKVISVARC